MRVNESRCGNLSHGRRANPTRKAGAQNHRPKELALHGSGIAELPESIACRLLPIYQMKANKGTTMKSKQLVMFNGRVIAWLSQQHWQWGAQQALTATRYVTANLAVTATRFLQTARSRPCSRFWRQRPIVTMRHRARRAGSVSVTCTTASSPVIPSSGSECGRARPMSAGAPHACRVEHLSYDLQRCRPLHRGAIQPHWRQPPRNGCSGRTHGIRGVSPPAQNVPAGNYSDTWSHVTSILSRAVGRPLGACLFLGASRLQGAGSFAVSRSRDAVGQAPGEPS